MSAAIRCLGQYCGQAIDAYGNYSECGACAKGYRADAERVCRKCVGAPSFYDWMYLAFMAISSLVLHWFFIDFTNKRKHKRLLILHISALVEAVLAAVCALLVVEPRWSLDLVACPVTQVADWYTLFYNPTPDYVNVIHCTQEAVYPLYTIVFVYYALSLACMLLLRPLLSAKLVMHRGTKSIYAALYAFPILICLHAILAGFIYYSFPYIAFVVSVITNAIHFALFKQQSAFQLVKSHATSPRNIVILLLHWLLHAYAIIAFTQLNDPSFYLPFICLVPFPAIFYVTTVKFTDPAELDSVM